MDKEELKWIKKAMKGNLVALEKLLIKYQDQMYRTAYLYMQNQEESLDVVQETAYLVTKNIYQLQEPKYFKTWVIRILINTAKNFLKKRQQVVLLSEIEAIERQQTLNDTEKITQHIDLIEAIGYLKQNYQDALILFYYHDLPTKEIAKLLNKPETTIRTDLARGREALKNQLIGDEAHG